MKKLSETTEAIILIVVFSFAIGMLLHSYLVIQRQSSQIDTLENLIITNNSGINLSDRCGYFNGEYFVVKTFSTVCLPTLDVTLHEYAHSYEYFDMKEREKDDWEVLFMYADDYITSYAMKDWHEDFAESFTHIADICIHRDKLDDLTPERQAFMTKHVTKDFVWCEG